MTSAAPDEKQRYSAIVVDDDVILRQRLSAILTGAGDFVVLGEAGTVAEGVDLVARAPQLALVDLGLPDGHGIEVIAALRAQVPAAKALVISVFEDRASVLGAFRAGADGYLLKDTPDDQMLAHVRETLAGETPISARAAGHLLSFVRAEQRQQPAADAPSLSPREKELLEHLARGLARKEVARQMGISHFTVGEYLQSIYRKLSVNSRGEAVYEALRARLISLGKDPSGLDPLGS
jgi:DNA-binding NarL/FixJ family response regulator